MTNDDVTRLEAAWKERDTLPVAFAVLCAKYVGDLVARLRKAEADLMVFLEDNEPDQSMTEDEYKAVLQAQHDASRREQERFLEP